MKKPAVWNRLNRLNQNRVRDWAGLSCRLVILALLIAGMGWAASSYMIQSLIFFPDKHYFARPSDYRMDYQEVQMASSAHSSLTAWYLPAPQSSSALIFFHGNAGNMSGRIGKASGWVKRGVSVLLVDYRGYGSSSGQIETEEDVAADARAALEWLMKEKAVPLSQIILYGESLGSYPAVRLGAEHDVRAVILEAPYTSFVDLAVIHYPWIPKPMTDLLMKKFRFSNAETIPQLKPPLLILHGTADEVCPYGMSRELFDKAPKPKEFFTIPGGAHNNLPDAAGESYWDKPFDFISRLS